MSMRPSIGNRCARRVEAVAGLALWLAVPASGMEAAIAAEAQGLEPGGRLTVSVDTADIDLSADDLLPGPLPVE